MRLFVYVVACDAGLAPNPFYGSCTLAMCKPAIRRRASPGDWVAGVGAKSRGRGGTLVFAMRVDEVLSIEDYAADPRFERKKPRPGASARALVGDNAYYRDGSGRWRRLPNAHPAKHMSHDLSGRNVLVSRHYWYFGARAVAIPPRLLRRIEPARGHRCNFPHDVSRAFIDWLRAGQRPGRHGMPIDLAGFCARAEHLPTAKRPPDVTGDRAWE